MKEIFEEVNGLKDCLQRCVTGMAGAFKKSQISRQLKAMGLRRNRLTDSQVRPQLHLQCPSPPLQTVKSGGGRLPNEVHCLP